MHLKVGILLEKGINALLTAYFHEIQSLKIQIWVFVKICGEQLNDWVCVTIILTFVL